MRRSMRVRPVPAAVIFIANAFSRKPAENGGRCSATEPRTSSEPAVPGRAPRSAREQDGPGGTTPRLENRHAQTAEGDAGRVRLRARDVRCDVRERRRARR
ncbi:hypothetical protein GCM10023088_37450 [Actinomadura verrucosospora]